MFRPLLISMFLTSTALADTWTVDDDGKADFDNIQAAVDAASDGDEIIVMPGTYRSTSSDAVVNMLGKAVWLHSSGGQEVTIIDGGGGCRGILCWSGETTKTIIEGFTITNGYTIGDGAGMYIQYASPTLDNCTFINNTGGAYGGGMATHVSSSTLTDCTFTGNNATPWNGLSYGGGMYNSGSNLTLNNCTFINNSARHGAGMYNKSIPFPDTISPTLDGCTFTGNTAEYQGGGMTNSTCSPTLTNCTFSNNTATYSGAGMMNFSGSHPVLTGCTFDSNSASDGAGVYNQNDSNPTLLNCSFTNNSGVTGAGMKNRWGCNPTLTNCTFSNNTASFAGGGVVNENESNSTLTDCTFTGNTATRGDGMYIQHSNSSSDYVGANTSDGLHIVSFGSLAFSAESTCDVTGSTITEPNTTIYFDIDSIDTSSSLNVSQSFNRAGGLVVSNNSRSLLAANSGDIIPLAQASRLVGNFDSMVFPTMPEGLGLQLIDYPALRGGDTEIAAEVIVVEGANFGDPFSGDLDSPPIDIVSFDADDDGRDEVAVLFGGTPGGVACYSVSQDGTPTPIDGLVANVGNDPVSIDAADLNNDGRNDLLIANSTDNSLSVLLTMEDIDGSLYFVASTISVPGSGQSITCVAAIDWDGDTDLDAVVGVDGVNNGYQVLLDISSAMTDGPWLEIPDYFLHVSYVPDPPTCVDGGNQYGDWGFVGGTRYGRIHRGTSVGSLQTIAGLGGKNTVAIEAIELDADGGDGQIDLMVSSDEAEVIYLFQGNAVEDDGFDDLIPLGVLLPVEDLIALYADDDGDMDIVMTAPTSDTPLVLLRNDGGGSGLIGSLSGITWSKQILNANSANTATRLANGTLGGKDEGDDWLVSVGGTVDLRGNETGTMEQTNIRVQMDCPADLTDDGDVAIADLLQLIAAWGLCESCPEDFNGDGAVAIADLLTLIAAWGPCE